MGIDLQVADFFLKLFDLIFRILVIAVIPVLLYLLRLIYKMHTEMKVSEQRICTLEEQIRDLPGEKSIHSLALTIEQLNGTVRGMGEAVKRLDWVVDRHEEYLHKGSGQA